MVAKPGQDSGSELHGRLLGDGNDVDGTWQGEIQVHSTVHIAKWEQLAKHSA